MTDSINILEVFYLAGDYLLEDKFELQMPA
jgi:hypothetical protein